MKREMTVTYAPGGREPRVAEQKPMLRIANHYLHECGFTVGSKFEVQYAKNLIIILLKKPTYEHNNLSKTNPVALSFGATTGEKGV